MKALLTLIIVILLASCKVQHVATSERITDSVNTSYIKSYRDTNVVISLPKQQVMNIINVQQVNGIVNSDTSVLKTDHAISRAWISDGKLFHTLNTINEDVNVTIKNAVSESHKEIEKKSSKDKVVQVVVKTNIIKWWQKILMLSGAIGIVYASFRFGKYLRFR